MNMYTVQIVVGEVRTLNLIAKDAEHARELALEVDSEHLEGSGDVSRAVLDAECIKILRDQTRALFLNGAEGVEVL